MKKMDPCPVDLFSKSSIYVNCTKCQNNYCKCTDQKRELKDYKTIFLSRVVLQFNINRRNIYFLAI